MSCFSPMIRPVDFNFLSIPSDVSTDIEKGVTGFSSDTASSLIGKSLLAFLTIQPNVSTDIEKAIMFSYDTAGCLIG